MNNIEVVCFVA